MKVRQKLRFFGRVQGVGFRYTAYHLANGFGLTGWVLNDWDGTVLMEVQGEEDSIKKMIERLDSGVFIEIQRIEKEMLSTVENECSFQIRG